MDKTAIQDLFQLIEVFAQISSSNYAKVFGPYNRSSDPNDKRKIVIVQDKDGKKRTISYPKFLYEEATGIKLKPNESVDHKDYDINNNDLENLQIFDRSEHSKLDTRRVDKEKFECSECKKKFYRFSRHIRDKSRKGSAGPFCSRSCAGKYSRRFQLGLTEKLPSQPMMESKYYRQKQKAAELAENLLIKYAIEFIF